MSEPLHEVMFGKIGRLKDTYRYSAQPVISRENVAEHSFWTAMIGVTICLQLDPMDTDMPARVALKALLHDIEECMTGDLVRDMKYASDELRDAIKKVEQDFLRNLLDPLDDVGKSMYEIWENSKDQTYSGQIVALADALSVISYCTKEWELGNSNLMEIRDACTRLIVNKFYASSLGEIAKSAIEESYRRWSL